MKDTRMPPAWSANLVANSGNTLYGVSVIMVPRHACLHSFSLSTTFSFWIPCYTFLEHKHGSEATGLWTRDQIQAQLEFRSHVVPKTVFQDGGDRTWIFTHKLTIFA